MKYLALILLLVFCSATGSLMGQLAPGFSQIELKNINGTTTSLQQYANEKPLIVIFTSVHCVYAKKYEERIRQTIGNYSDKIQFLLINSNDPQLSPEDSYENLALRAIEKPFPSAYLVDPTQSLATALKVEKAPEAFVFRPDKSEEEPLFLIYRGAIDNNPLQADRVSLQWLWDAIGHTLDGNQNPVPFHPVKGCNIKRMM